MLQALLQKGATSSARSSALDEQIAAKQAKSTEVDAKHAAREEFAREQEEKLEEAARLALEKKWRVTEIRRQLNMAEAESAEQDKLLERDAAKLANSEQVLATASRRREEPGQQHLGRWSQSCPCGGS